jgi:hypothetical protein
MKTLVAYATRHGATAGIAERIAATLTESGRPAQARPVEEVTTVEGMTRSSWVAQGVVLLHERAGRAHRNRAHEAPLAPHDRHRPTRRWRVEQAHLPTAVAVRATTPHLGQPITCGSDSTATVNAPLPSSRSTVITCSPPARQEGRNGRSSRQQRGSTT